MKEGKKNNETEKITSFLGVLLLSLLLLGGTVFRPLPLWVVVPSSSCLILLNYKIRFQRRNGSTTTQNEEEGGNHPEGAKRRQHHPQEK